MMNGIDETQCGKVTPQSRTTAAEEARLCRLKQVNAPGCISYDTFYRALQFTYCGEVDPSSPVPHSPDSFCKVSVYSSLFYRLRSHTRAIFAV